MASGRRYFILDQPLPASEIPNMLGRVVSDKLLPMRSYAPVDPVPGNNEPRCHPEDIIPDILPKPIIWSNTKEFLSCTSERSVRGGLETFFGIRNSNETQSSVSLESQEVKCYSLTNTTQHFEKLMCNELYARDVRELLKRSRHSHVYFVVGLLTTKGTLWKVSKYNSRKLELGVNIPVLEAVRSTLPGLDDPQIAPGFGNTERLERSVEVEDELIFALAYDVIKRSYELDLNSKALLKRILINVGPKRAKAKYLAFAGSDDDDDDFVDSDEEEVEVEASRRKDEGLVCVKLEDCAKEEELCEAKQVSVDSFTLLVGEI